jgi:COP9 signalosome complex subunit 3
MIYLGLKKWGRAVHALEVVISAPSSTSTSVIMVEAYKKWVLAGLINKGTVRGSPFKNLLLGLFAHDPYLYEQSC